MAKLQLRAESILLLPRQASRLTPMKCRRPERPSRSPGLFHEVQKAHSTLAGLQADYHEAKKAQSVPAGLWANCCDYYETKRAQITLAGLWTNSHKAQKTQSTPSGLRHLLVRQADSCDVQKA